MRKTRYMITIALIIILILSFKYTLYDNIDGIGLDIDKCPSCYGISCDIVNNNEFDLFLYSRLKLINTFFNVKNIFYGRFHTSNFVLKKLAHTDELKEYDARLCKSVNLPSACDVAEAVTSLVKNYDHNLTLVIANNEELFAKSEAMKCRHPQVLTTLYNRFHSVQAHGEDLQHFVTLLAINPEPLIIETFGDIIPVPRYFEACGRLVVEEFAGWPLSHYYEEPWLRRASFALQLLQIADAMTEHDIRMYLTDPSADNFAVDKEGLLKLIDAENIVLVDSQEKGLKNSIHCNDGFGCSDCFSYDYEDLCQHFKSDHNYFAVCKGLLSSKPFSSSLPGGLLHSIPEEVMVKAPNLPSYIEECAQPKIFENRIDPAQFLSRFLAELVSVS